MCLAQGTVFTLGRTKEISKAGFLIRPALVHLVTTVRTEQKPGKHTHIAHSCRTAAGFADVLHNEKYAFLNDRRLGVLKDSPIRRIIPELLFALVGLLSDFEVHRMPQILNALQHI